VSLTTSEVQRLKFELGFSNVGLGGDPWIGYSSLFDNVIQPFLQGGAATTSSTAVTASESPAPVTLTLASATGFSAFDRVVVDVDSREETATLQSVAGSNITLLLSKAHGGTYPVVVEGGETQVRHHLRQLQLIGDAMGGAGVATKVVGIKKADEIEFFGPGEMASQSALTQLTNLRHYWRGELAKVCGIYEMWASRQGSGGSGGGSSIALY
jgi:hypothetical protein